MDIKTIDFNTDEEIRFKNDDVIIFRFKGILIDDEQLLSPVEICDPKASKLNIFNLSFSLQDIIDGDIHVTYGDLVPLDKSVLDIMQYGYAIPVKITGQLNMDFYVYWSNLDKFNLKSKMIQLEGLYNSEQVMPFFRPKIVYAKDENL
jgi:hypothetical protein